MNASVNNSVKMYLQCGKSSHVRTREPDSIAQSLIIGSWQNYRYTSLTTQATPRNIQIFYKHCELQFTCTTLNVI